MRDVSSVVVTWILDLGLTPVDPDLINWARGAALLVLLVLAPVISVRQRLPWQAPVGAILLGFGWAVAAGITHTRGGNAFLYQLSVNAGLLFGLWAFARLIGENRRLRQHGKDDHDHLT